MEVIYKEYAHRNNELWRQDNSVVPGPGDYIEIKMIGEGKQSYVVRKLCWISKEKVIPSELNVIIPRKAITTDSMIAYVDKVKRVAL